MSSDSTKAPPKPGGGSQAARQYFAFSIGLCAAFIVVPFLIVLIDRWLSYAAPWRFRHYSRTHNHRRSFDQWYGWTRKKRAMHMGQTWKYTQGIICYVLQRRHKTRNYDWCFWDPDGSGARAYEDSKFCSIWRRLPQWHKSCAQCIETANGRTCDLEQGMHTISACGAPNICTLRLSNFPLGPSEEVWRGQEDDPDRRAHKQLSMELSRYSLLNPGGMQVASTARRRSILGRGHSILQAQSEETNTATTKRILKTRKCHQGSTRVAYKHALSTRYCSEGPASSPVKMAINATLKTRSFSDTFATGTPTIDATKYSISPHESQQVPWTTLNTSHNLPGSRAPRNSLNPDGTAFSQTSCKLVACTAQEDPCTSLALRYQQKDFTDVSNLQVGICRPKPNSAHMTADQDMYDESYNTTAKQGDCIALRPKKEFSCGHSFDVLSAYEFEDSLDEAESQCDSSTSTRSDMARLCQHRRLWFYEPHMAANCRLTSEPRKAGERRCTEAYGSMSDVGHQPLRKMFATSLSCVVPHKRGRAVDRGIHVSLFDWLSETGDRRESGDRRAVCKSSESGSHSWLSSTDMKPKVARRASDFLLPVNLVGSLRSQWGKTRNDEPLERIIPLPGLHALTRKEHRRPTDHQYVISHSEAVFLRDLNSKLERLQYELTPGFRGPKSVFCVSWPVDAPMFKPILEVQTRNRESSVGLAGKTHNTTGREYDVDQRETIQSMKLLDWRTAVNKARTCDGCENISCRPKFPILNKEGFDTAAWMLRRPPQGSGSDLGPPTTLYAGTFDRHRTLAEWNARTAPNGSGEADLTEQPAKALRIGSKVVKMVMHTKHNGWFHRKQNGVRDVQV